MRVQVAKWGNSAAVRLPKAVMDELRIAPGASLDLTVERDAVRLAVPPRRRSGLADRLALIDRLGLKPPPFEDWGELETEWPPYERDDAG
jgi:antitoxin MazE